MVMSPGQIIWIFVNSWGHILNRKDLKELKKNIKKFAFMLKVKVLEKPCEHSRGDIFNYNFLIMCQKYLLVSSHFLIMGHVGSNDKSPGQII